MPPKGTRNHKENTSKKKAQRTLLPSGRNQPKITLKLNSTLAGNRASIGSIASSTTILVVELAIESIEALLPTPQLLAPPLLTLQPSPSLQRSISPPQIDI